MWLLWGWNVQFQEFNRAGAWGVFTQIVLQIVSTPTTVPEGHANALCALFLMNSTHTRLLLPCVSAGPPMQSMNQPFLSLLHPLNQILQIPATQTLQKMDFSRETDCKYLFGVHCLWFSTLLNKCNKQLLQTSHLLLRHRGSLEWCPPSLIVAFSPALNQLTFGSFQRVLHLMYT